VKLLRVLQERQFEPVGSNKTEKVDVRVILASNEDLAKVVEAGRFRQDLFYRVNVVTIQLSRLRDRLGDIPLLADHFLKLYRMERHKDLLTFTDDCIKCLQRYHWPGNVRELENVIERAVVLTKNRQLTAEDLPESIVEYANSSPVPTGGYRPQSLKRALEHPEKTIIEEALRANNWNRQTTAQLLEINRTTLYKKMKRYGLETDPVRGR
jgi:DNA-binding NtrC family response regulator